jgi:hypothetical protein
MDIFVRQPFLAALPCIVLAGLFAASKRPVALVAAGLWLIYLPYEYAMKVRLLCSGECNIRVDLLLIYPVLLVVTLVACVVSARVLWARRRKRAEPA